MIIVLSPAKSLDYETPSSTRKHTLPAFLGESAALIDILRTLAPQDLSSLMKISDPLAQLNAGRYAEWSKSMRAPHAKQALLAFNGDVYTGLDAGSLSAEQLDHAQKQVRILSGLYGVLRPLDLIRPYRLEMGTQLANSRGKDLYAFWGDQPTLSLKTALKASGGKRVLVNLASDEYFKAVRPSLLDAPVVTPVFQDWKNGAYKIISFFAKRARGLMTRYALDQALTSPEGLKDFERGGYRYAPDVSTDTQWIFRRREPA